MLNFPEDDVDITSENSYISCLNTQSSQVYEENDATPSLNNNTLTPDPLTDNSDSNEKEEMIALKQDFKILEKENKFLRNDVVSKQNSIDSLLEYNSNLVNHQCRRFFTRSSI